MVSYLRFLWFSWGGACLLLVWLAVVAGGLRVMTGLGLLLLALLGLAARKFTRELGREWEFIEARKHFDALVLHPGRSPVTAIRMYATILQKQYGHDPLVVGREAERLMQVVHNLLGLGPHQCGDSLLERQDFDLHPVIRQVATRRVNWQLDPNLPRVHADREAVLLCLSNLVHNAYQHGDGEVTIATRAGDGLVHLEVMDRGPGIAAERRLTVFEAYRGRTAAGVGLGLALTRCFCLAMGGGLVLEDRPGGGALFRLSLPVARR